MKNDRGKKKIEIHGILMEMWKGIPWGYFIYTVSTETTFMVIVSRVNDKHLCILRIKVHLTWIACLKSIKYNTIIKKRYTKWRERKCYSKKSVWKMSVFRNGHFESDTVIQKEKEKNSYEETT